MSMYLGCRRGLEGLGDSPRSRRIRIRNQALTITNQSRSRAQQRRTIQTKTDKKPQVPFPPGAPSPLAAQHPTVANLLAIIDIIAIWTKKNVMPITIVARGRSGNTQNSAAITIYVSTLV
ncbi:hypothetical protein G7Y89_g9284 [Cudoniella acicularis]|uniref:Uncharacterized protein n=1 Tax=Cudoniella acicularis TaxID=354080 RepID=A0A8H4W070_9HELO|nr:hypothetical protein G7Y89_g9284 [Cudoniella acicularis]